MMKNSLHTFFLTKIILFTMVSSWSLFSQDVNAIDAFAWHSTVSDPKPRKIKINTSGVLFEENSVSRGGVEIIHAGKSCDFKKNSTLIFSKWRKDCQLALQFLYSTEHYIKMIKESGLNFNNKVVITIEDQNSSCFAAATYREDAGLISFCPVNKKDLDNYLQFGSEILFHELTHLLVEDRRLDFFLLASGHEDFPTLFSYFFTGRVFFKIPNDGIYDPAVKFGTLRPGNYGSLIPLTSSIIDFQKIIFGEIKSTSDKERFFKQYLRIVTNLFFEITENTNEREYLNNLLARTMPLLVKLSLSIRKKIEKNFRKSVFDRGLDLNQSAYEGLRQTILVNNVPVSVPHRINLKRVTDASDRKNPILTFYDPNNLVKGGLTGFVLGPDFINDLDHCISKTTSQKEAHLNYYSCIQKISKKPLSFCGKNILQKDFKFKKHLDEFRLFNPSEINDDSSGECDEEEGDLSQQNNENNSSSSNTKFVFVLVFNKDKFLVNDFTVLFEID
jgi:hypothetical protein